MDRDEMSILYRGPSIDASYQVSVHLAEGFQRRRLKCEKLTDAGRQVMAKAHIAFGKDPHVPMLKGWVGPSSFPRIMNLKVVFQMFWLN
jgi:hypothetical protein